MSANPLFAGFGKHGSIPTKVQLTPGNRSAHSGQLPNCPGAQRDLVPRLESFDFLPQCLERNEATLSEIVDLVHHVAGDGPRDPRLDAAIEFATAYFEIEVVRNNRQGPSSGLNKKLVTFGSGL